MTEKQETITYQKSVRVFDTAAQRVIKVPEDELSTVLSQDARITRALPTFTGIRGRAVFHRAPDQNLLTEQALKRALSAAKANGFGQLDLTGMDTAILYADNPTVTVVDLLTYIAADVERQGDQRQADGLINLAINLDRKQHIPTKDTEASAEWTPLPAAVKLMPTLDNRTFSTGTSFLEHREDKTKTAAHQKVTEAQIKINKPFTVVVQEIQASLGKVLVDKRKKLITADGEDVPSLTAEIAQIEANIEYCNIFVTEKADYTNYKDIEQVLESRIQDQIESEASTSVGVQLLDGENRYQAITSLGRQFDEAKRKQEAAKVFMFGDAEKGRRGLLPDAQSFRKDRLIATKTEEGIPLINAFASEKTANWIYQQALQQGIDLNDPTQMYSFVQANWEDTTALETIIRVLSDTVEGLDPQENGFIPFFSKLYATSDTSSGLDDLKVDAMRLLSPALANGLNIDIQQQHKNHVEQINAQAETEDFIGAALQHEQEAVIRSVAHNIEGIIHYLGINPENRDQFITENGDTIARVIVAYQEITDQANDQHLNPNAVLENIANAAFNNDPMTLQIVRCLRWCYPNRELAFTPTGGDFQSYDVDGNPIMRRESVERKKLEIFNDTVVKPITHQEIPVGTIRLLCTGDFELIGPGYGLTDKDEPVQDARLYVLDQIERVPQMGIFGDIPVEVIPFRGFTVADKLSLLKKQVASVIETQGQATYDMIIQEAKRDSRILDSWFNDPENNLSDEPIAIEGIIERFGSERFSQILEEVSANYDALSQDNQLNYLGYTASSIERIIDTEHEHRQPFVHWWNRQRSRDYTRHYLTFGIALGAVISAQGEPQLVTVSGNQFAAKYFSHGYEIFPTNPLGVTLYKSVNDGTQSALYQQMSTVLQ